MSKHTLNVEAFALFVYAHGKHSGHDRLLDAAEAAGVSKAQMFRAIHKQPINTQAFLSLCIWMNTNPFAFLLDAETGRGLAPLPDASREAETETRSAPQHREAA